MGYRIGFYGRISDDDDNIGTSESVKNQIEFLTDYVKRNSEFANSTLSIFQDDGFSGINMNRPAIQELLTNIRCRRIDCVMVKDLSRFSRNFLEATTYLDKIFPFMNVRFISVLDKYDSDQNIGKPLDMGVAFKTIFHEYYIYDISEKIKRAYAQKRERGEHTGGLPYGYSYSKIGKGDIEIDLYSAEIVRRIFQMRLDGISAKNICKTLHDEGVESPSRYRGANSGYQRDDKFCWNRVTIYSILHNRFYIGECAGNKTSRDLKTKKITRLCSH